MKRANSSDENKASGSKKSKNEEGNFIDEIHNNRKKANSILEFKFNKKRIKILNGKEEVPEDRTGGIAYWMARDQRIQGKIII